MTGFIFDFNGTLFYDTPKHLAAWNQMSIELRGIPLTEEELNTKFKGVPNRVTVPYLLGHECDDITPYSLRKEEIYRGLCKEDKDNFHLVAGAEELFDHLKEQSIPFTICSASIEINMHFFIESFHLNKWLTLDEMVYDNGSYENKVAMFLDSARKLGVDIRDTVIFEDSVSGIKSAYEAGCRKIIAVNTDKTPGLRDMKGVVQEISNFESFDFDSLI